MLMSSKNRQICHKYKMNISEVKNILDKYHLDHKFEFADQKLCKSCGVNYVKNKDTCYECEISFNFVHMFITFLLFCLFFKSVI